MALEAAVFCEPRVMYGLWAWGWGYHSLHSLPSEQVVKELYHVWVYCGMLSQFLILWEGWSEKQSL